MTRIKRAIGVMLVFIATQALPAQPADDLALAHQLAQAGAPQLALERVSRFQPSDPRAPQWDEWESVRCSALAGLGRHAQLVERAAALPAAARTPSLATCLAGGARAALALERHRDARRSAARALWEFALAPAEVQAMRRLVIDAYVGEQRGEDAYRAMLRYQQDYSPLPQGVLARFVDGLLDLGMDREALAWLSRLDDAQPAKLRLRVRAGLVPRDAAAAQARSALAKGGDKRYWSVLLDAAGDGAGLLLRVEALEHALDADVDVQPASATASRRLWDAYLAAAASVANAAGLLVGDDANWADHAGRRLGGEPAVARSLFAHLAQRAQSAATRHNAQLQLLSAYQTEHMERVALRVFDAIFGDVDALDSQVRYRLGSMAEARGQHAVAARYWRDLPAPPDMDGGEWLLRLSRQRWLAGPGGPRLDAVMQYYAGQRSATPGAVEQAVAYAGMLTARGAPVAARRLMEVMLPHVERTRSRAVLDELGRAREAAGEPALAAEAYLASALLASSPADASAVRARLLAGMALARAGYARDARAQFEWVLSNSKDAAVLETARTALKPLQL